MLKQRCKNNSCGYVLNYVSARSVVNSSSCVHSGPVKVFVYEDARVCMVSVFLCMAF